MLASRRGADARPPIAGENRMTASHSDALERFVRALEASWDETGGAEEALLPRVEALMRELVARDDWLDPAKARPHPQYYQQHLLHADASDRFSVVSFVWGPGQETPIHDHTVWGVIGMLRGAEQSQPYALDGDGVPRPAGAEELLRPGDVSCVSPRIGDVHRVRNAHGDRVSISIHAYGGNIGTIRRHVFPPEGGPAKAFVSGYSSGAD
jgi:predicted metal-dependent enzyme (double-stranded beta helix superfamily)